MAQSNRNPKRSRRTGAYAAGEDTARRRPGWLIPLLALLGLLLIGLVLWLVLHNRGSDSSKTASAATPTSSTTPTATESSATAADTATATATATATTSASPAAGGGTAADGQLLAGGQAVLPLTAGSTDLSRYTGQSATARTVAVQSVPADEGFWVGTSATDRVWVQLTGPAGESPITVKAGDRISFTTGKVVATPAGYADKVGVDAADGAVQLGAQKAHIEIAKSAIKLSP